MYLTNLLSETIDNMRRHGHALENVEHITLYGMGVALDDFIAFAEDFDYDGGYGSEEVPPFVIKMDDDSWYDRREYDGSEWWECHSAPSAPKEFGSIADAIMEADMAWLWRKAYEHATFVEPEASEDEPSDEWLDLIDELDAIYA